MFSFSSSAAQNEGCWSLLALFLDLAFAWCKAQSRTSQGNLWEGLNWDILQQYMLLSSLLWPLGMQDRLYARELAAGWGK